MVKRCLVVGSINIDEFYQVPHIALEGQTISSSSLVRRAGGKGANTSVAVAASGQAVDLAAWIGQDGCYLRDDVLKSYGVGTKHLQVNPQDLATGRAIIQLSQATKDNCIVLYRGANFTSQPALPQDLSPYSVLVCENEIPLEFTLQALQAAKDQDITTVFNPSPVLTDTEVESVDWQNIDWLIVNEDELIALYVVLSGLTEQVDWAVALQELHAHSLLSNTNMVVTRGAQGVSAISAAIATESWFVEAPAGILTQPLVNTTGAGDCFTGYFAALVSRLKHPHHHIESIIRIAQQAAAICVESDGAMESVPKLAAVQARINELKQHWPSWLQ